MGLQSTSSCDLSATTTSSRGRAEWNFDSDQSWVVIFVAAAAAVVVVVVSKRKTVEYLFVFAW